MKAGRSKPFTVSRGIALVIGAAAMAAVVWLVTTSWMTPPRPAERQASPTLSPPEPMAPAELPATPARGANTEVVVSRSTCPYQRLEITSATGVQTACVSATRSTQTGSLRSHAVDAVGVSNWRLRVDVAGGQVRAVRLAEVRPASPGAAPAVFACKGKRCRGVSIGEPDRQGVRRIALEAVPLKAVAVAGTEDGDAAPSTASTSVRVAGLLQLAPESQNVARACPTPSVTVLDDRGAAADFCPDGGAGFEVADDGRLSVLFMNLEGRRLAVGLAADGSLETVTLGAMKCAAPYCGGASQAVQGDAAEPGAERSFAFSGVTLRAGSHPGAPSVTLSGGLTMPAQNR